MVTAVRVSWGKAMRGGVITALVMQKRDKERVNVFVDGEYAFSLSLVEAARLKKGQTLTEAEVAALRAQDDVQRTMDRALRFLGHRPRSVQEVRRKLAEYELPESTISLVIERLQSQGYLDDMAFARYWLENRDTFKPRGPKAIRFELRQKGVPDRIIEAVLEELDADDGALRAARDQARRLRGYARRDFRHKITNFLMRRGYDGSTSRAAIEKVMEELAADDPDFFAED
jgi:regulatory protein